MLTAYYTRSDMNSGVVGIGSQSFDVSGSGEFYGLKAVYALPKIGNLSHNASVAWDSRYFESNVAFQGAALPASRVASRPISLGYALHSDRAEAKFRVEAEYVFNTDGGSANDETSYTAARAGAKQYWNAVRSGIDASWTLKGKLRMQYSNDALIPGEQIGIAGLTTVRGFREREVTGDKGYVVNVEGHGPKLWGGLAPFVFFDAGGRRQVVPTIGPSPTNEFISSAGAGVRWQWRGLDVAATWAFVIDGAAGGTSSGHQKGYLTAFYRF